MPSKLVKFTLLLASLAPFTLADLPSISHVRVPENAFEPVQVRLAYAGATGMQISWNTFSRLPSPPTVRYGFKQDLLPFVSSPENAESVTYPTSLTFSNHVRLEHLHPNTKYFYQPIHANASSIYSFTTAREKGDHTPYSAAVVVDLGLIGPQGLSTTVGVGAANPLLPGEVNTMQSLQKDNSWDFLWHREFQPPFLGLFFRSFLRGCTGRRHILLIRPLTGPSWRSIRTKFFLVANVVVGPKYSILNPSFFLAGDIAYADYWLKEEIQGFLPNTSIADGVHVYESLLNQFFDEMTPLTSQRAYMVGPGNHEANCKW
jgi:hypothetical protein